MKRVKYSSKNRLNLLSYDSWRLSFEERKILSKMNINCIELQVKNRRELVRKLKKYTTRNEIHIFLTRLGINFNQEIYKFLSSPKIILTYTTGINHISLPKKIIDFKLIKLDNADKKLHEIPSTAEFTIGLILNLIRKINLAQNDVKNNFWRREFFFGRQLKNLSVGVIGNGRVGNKVVKFCKTFGSKVFTYDVLKKKRNSSLEKLLKYSDVVTLHLKYKNKMKNFFDKKKFNLMKNNSYFINTSRGELVNENDLINAIKSKKIQAAALDVLKNDSISEKKINKKNMLKIINFSKSSNRLMILPHLGGATYDSMKITKKIIFDKLSILLNKINFNS